MKSINDKATAIMNQLTESLNEEDRSRKIDNTPGYMATCVELIQQTNSGPLFSVAHYFEQNGDLMRDPDMVFIRCQDNKYYPVSFQQDSLGIYQEVVLFDIFTTPQVNDEECQRQLAEFANGWMLNIQQQQNLS
jgi:hypothetical protein